MCIMEFEIHLSHSSGLIPYEVLEVYYRASLVWPVETRWQCEANRLHPQTPGRETSHFQYGRHMSESCKAPPSGSGGTKVLSLQSMQWDESSVMKWRLWRMVNRQGGHGKPLQFCSSWQDTPKGFASCACYFPPSRSNHTPNQQHCSMAIISFFLRRVFVQLGDFPRPIYFSLAIQEMADECKSDNSWWEFLPESVKLSKMITWGWLILLLPWVYGWNHKMLTSSIYPDNCNAVQSLKALLPLFMSKSYKTVII